ncbi:Holliday junction branch migration protein RuvA [Candidatus Cloacimonadota bacterium]
MIAYLEGVLQKKEPVTIVIDCAGVGYEVNIPLSTYDKLSEVGKQTKVHIHYSFNEMDGVRLFGFLTIVEKNLFRNLISISKIGPKLALAILSGLPVNDLIRAVQMGDVGLIATIPGIGKKSAERLIIELKDKVGGIVSQDILAAGTDSQKGIIIEAESALITLGYKQFEVRKAINKLVKDHEFKSSEEVVKATIRALYKKRNI